MDRFLGGAVVGALAGGLVAGGVAVATVKWPLLCAVDGSLFWTAAGAVGSAAAAVAAVWIAASDRRGQDEAAAARRRVAAARLYVPVYGLATTLEAFIEVHQRFAAVQPGPASRAVENDVAAVDAACDELGAIIPAISLEETAHLPVEVAENLAIGVGGSELCRRSAAAAVRCYLAAETDKDRFEAGHEAVTHDTAARALNHIRVFVAWRNTQAAAAVEI